MLEAKEVNFAYRRGLPVLNDIACTIGDGEFVALLGHNGSGKTTLSRLFMALLHPRSGQVLVDGEDIVNYEPADLADKIGYVFQNPDDQLFLESVRKEFEFGPKQIGMPEDEIQKRIEWVAELVGLKDKLDMHPFDLTSTEKKFCTIGAIIMMDPKAVIFDEPTCGQDVAGNIRLREIIRQLKENGKLCITISHDMKFVVDNFKRIIVMCKGQVLLDGPVEEVFAQVETLKKSFVTPPPITKVAQGAGFKETVFTTEAFMKVFEERKGK